MFKNLQWIDIVKSILVLLLIALPPWITLRKYLKRKINELVLILLFTAYISATVFTQNFMPFIAVILTIYFTVKNENDEEIYYFRPLHKNKTEVILYSFVFKFIITLVNLFFVAILMKVGLKVEGQEILSMFINAGWLKVIILSIITAIFAPVVEEFVFRNYLYRIIKKRTGQVLSAIITSTLFAVLHFNLAGIVSFFGLGIYNCYLYEKYGYRAAVMNHFIFNSISVIFIIIFKALNINYVMALI